MMIEGVVLKKLETHFDERGFFREILRVTDECFQEGFGQLSHSYMNPGVIKAWHVHSQQTDWWYVSNGVLRVVLYDTRRSSSPHKKRVDILMGDEQDAQVLKIPPGVAHGCKCINGQANLFYVTSHTYNPEDEGRIPHDDPEIGYDWIRDRLSR